MKHAFPNGLSTTQPDGNRLPFDPGMTLREYAAIKIAAGMVSAEGEEVSYRAQTLAKRAVVFADALLAELQKDEVQK